MLTEEQSKIVEFKGQSLKVKAYAGTGKSFTLTKKIEHDPGESHLYWVFNAPMKEKALSQINLPNATIKTCHGSAYAKFGSKYRRGNFRNPSTYAISKDLRVPFPVAYKALKTVENWANSSDTDIGERHVPIPSIYAKKDEENIPELAQKIWENMFSQKNVETYPMPHYGYLKEFQLSDPELDFDCILLDEAQDTNPVVSHIVERQKSKGKRVIVVGDPYQSIYSWRGAVNYLDSVEGETMFLTSSFRFGPKIGEAASKLLSIFFNEKNPLIGRGPETTIGNNNSSQYTVITRSNGWSVYQAYLATKNGKSIYIPGAENRSLTIFSSLMDVYNLYAGNKRDIKNQELKNVSGFLDLGQLVDSDLVYDYELVICYKLVKKHGADIPRIIEAIQRNLKRSSAEAQVTITTAHKAKGLEWENVVIENDFPPIVSEGHPSPLKVTTGKGDNTTTVNYEEVNSLYVALTRATGNVQLNNDLTALLNDFQP